MAQTEFRTPLIWAHQVVPLFTYNHHSVKNYDNGPKKIQSPLIIGPELLTIWVPTVS